MTTSAPQARVALFDLDHTLIPFDSDHSWGDYMTSLGWADAAFKARGDAFYQDYSNGTLDIHEYVRFSVAPVVQRGAQASHAAHQGYMREVVQPQILPVAQDMVRQHLDAGDEVIIVTATNVFVTQPIAAAFGVKHLIGIDLAIDPSTGWYNGEIAGVPSFKEGKVQRVGDWLAARGWSWDSVHVTAYSDSKNDIPMLEKANVAIATNPDATLRALAQERGWRILDIFA
ncbi:HAD-IB family hydrolase [Curvibacter sp. CHRR-16]|uniref:HAD family hydrolase n=1 Tax=Curvibacter sp. CHRR-16 TaxID=2835872 RepID=UPI001BD9929C|nr:HAD-IB family hydrolase [Curvibacter sp. CHRR-16]MBT0569174.1 HAD-IB family hydrolase [Curvibacter sp. CHRR-16]